MLCFQVYFPYLLISKKRYVILLLCYVFRSTTHTCWSVRSGMQVYIGPVKKHMIKWIAKELKPFVGITLHSCQGSLLCASKNCWSKSESFYVPCVLLGRRLSILVRRLVYLPCSGKRSALDLGEKGDQEEHWSIMEMAAAIKFIIWDENINSFATKDDTSNADNIIISAMANLQVTISVYLPWY